jgi:hypothetical protein
MDVKLDLLKFFYDNSTIDEIIVTIQAYQSALVQTLSDYPQDISTNLQASINSVLPNWKNEDTGTGANGYQAPN